MNKEAVARELVAVAKMLGDSRIAARMEWDRSFFRPKSDKYDFVEEIKVPDGLDLEIWKYGKDGKFFGVAFQGKSQKPLWNYSFRTEQRLDDYIQKTIEERKAKLDFKNKQKEERQQFRHDFQVGDILYSTWGYDQTNVDFYQVVGVTEKSVSIREIGQKPLKAEMGADYVVATPGKFTGPAMNKKVSPGNSVKIKSFSRAYKWDGKPKYQTAFGWGH